VATNPAIARHVYMKSICADPRKTMNTKRRTWRGNDASQYDTAAEIGPSVFT